MSDGYSLFFEDGPGDGLSAFTAVPPADARWFVEYEGMGWWVFHAEPEPEDGVQITKYVKYKEAEVDGETHVYYKMETK